MAMVYRICQNCGTEYRTHHTVRLKYCSQTCAGIAKRKGQENTCIQCGKSFYVSPSKSEQQYCSHSCAITARNLTEANPSYHRDISGENNPMYGKKRNGADNPMYGRTKELAPRWNGGRRTRPDGYVYILAPDDHPCPAYTKASGSKYILEHRYVIEQHLGRYLEPGEVVHHIDENPSNNDISNLRLYSSQSEHISDAH